MKRQIGVSVVVLLILLIGMPVQACTLWAANGNAVEGGGSFILKNRDWQPDHQQTVQLVLPDAGYRYIGLFAINGSNKGLKAGINEKGLVVISATAGSIPSKQRAAMTYTRGLSARLLKECGNVEEVLAKTALFLGPQILMLADKEKVATVEIGPAGKYSIAVKKDGAMYHTNHYVAESMLEFNKINAVSSQTRYNRIAELLSSHAFRPYDFNTFVSFCNDQNDGPDNSIFRIGSTPKKSRTMAVWAVSIVPTISPTLYVKLINPGKDERVLKINTDDVFSGEVTLAEEVI